MKACRQAQFFNRNNGVDWHFLCLLPASFCSERFVTAEQAQVAFFEIAAIVLQGFGTSACKRYLTQGLKRKHHSS